MRENGRLADELRPVSFDRQFPGAAPDRVLVSAGNTVILCTASIDQEVPSWLAGRGKGWVTGEESTFSHEELDAMLAMASSGIARLKNRQQDALASAWPF